MFIRVSSNKPKYLRPVKALMFIISDGFQENPDWSSQLIVSIIRLYQLDVRTYGFVEKSTASYKDNNAKDNNARNLNQTWSLKLESNSPQNYKLYNETGNKTQTKIFYTKASKAY